MFFSNNSSNLNNNNSNNAKVYLNCEQKDKLIYLLERSIPICSSSPSSFPILNITPKHFLRQVIHKLKEHSIDITSICLNGGAASYVLANDSNFIYRDIDILIHIKTSLSSEQKTNLFSSNNEFYFCDVWTIIKYIICSCVLENIKDVSSTEQQYTYHYLSTLLDAYAKKNIKISSEQDSWALLSLQNYSGQNLELKFVERLKRQWQFSVDSFQINLKTLLDDKRIDKHLNQHLSSMYTTPTSISSITKTIKTKSLIIDAINGLVIMKKERNNEEKNVLKIDNEQIHHNNTLLTSTSPLRFGFFTPSSSPDIINCENNIEYQTLATITTVSTSNNDHDNSFLVESRSCSSVPEFNEESSLQFHLSLSDDTDDGIVSDAEDSSNEDSDLVFRTPVDTNSAPSSPATIVAIEIPPSSSSSTIEVYSVYQDLHQALDHLNKKLIATYAPETLRGGGLLKYCDLLAQNYKVHDSTDMFRMQRYMCSRFFIDYKTIPEQMHVITQYVTTHFLPLSITSIDQSAHLITQYQSNQIHSKFSSIKHNDQTHVMNARLCLLFFDHLLTVIQQSTVCLTRHDKELTLMNINHLKEYYHYQYEHLFVGDRYHYQRYHSHIYRYHNFSSSSSNSSRSSSPSSLSSNSLRFHRHNPNAHYRHHPIPRQISLYHHGSRNYSNIVHSNLQGLLKNHHQHRRQL